MAREWDGAGDVIRYAAGVGIDDLSLAAFSLHAWINADNVGEANTGRILDKDDTTGTQGGWLFFTDATASLGFITVDSGGGVEAQQRGADNAITLGTWHSVVVTYDNDGDRKGHIYVDGSEIGYDTDVAAGAGQNSGDSGVPLAIGNRADALLRDYDGEISEVACWSRVITAAEISALASGFAPLFFLSSLGFYAPLVRGADDYFGHAATITNTTVTTHPSIFRPIKPHFVSSLPAVYVPAVFGDHPSEDPLRADGASGAPTHSAAADTFYWDETAPRLYLNTDGTAGGWAAVPAAPHIESVFIVAKSSAYTITASDGLVTGDASGGTFTITLPTAVGIAGTVYRVKKIDSSANVVTVAADGSETIDGGTTATIATQYEAITIVSDGTEWWVL